MRNAVSKISESVIRGSVFGISAATAAAIISIAYAAVPWGSLPQVTGTDTLSSQSWNDLIAHVNQSVKQTSETIAVNGGNVGIGNPSPGQKLSVAGTIESTSGGFKFPDGSVQATSAVSAGKIVNVTGYRDCTRRSLSNGASITMASFNVNKISSTSSLFIQGSISAYGNYSGSMTQGWKLGAGTEAMAQNNMFDENNNGKTLPTQTIIAGHATTGVQTLVFRYFAVNNSSGEKPFLTYNPNSTDDARLAQTCSTYSVLEVEQ